MESFVDHEIAKLLNLLQPQLRQVGVHVPLEVKIFRVCKGYPFVPLYERLDNYAITRDFIQISEIPPLSLFSLVSYFTSASQTNITDL